MPFPLAHPAAVLPFRRCSTRYLNFVALVVGAITPDLSYCLEKFDVDILAHSVRGCFLFSLPVGWVLIGVFYALGEPIVDALPAPHRQALLPLCRIPSQLWFAVPLSLLIGSGTHVFWDSFTHETGWFVERSSFLQVKLFSRDGHSFRVYRLLWHLSTWVGLFLLYRVYASVLRTSPGAADSLCAEERRRYALWAGLLFVPLVGAVFTAFVYYADKASSIATVPQVLRLSAILYLLAMTALLVALGTAIKMKRRWTG
jgi:Domain of unknown function (DUF4184)